MLSNLLQVIQTKMDRTAKILFLILISLVLIAASPYVFGDDLSVTGDISFTGQLNGTGTTSIWSKQAAADQACNTTCTHSCVFGFDEGTSNILNCVNATADSCICAGPN
jgi:hypothetical protein